jgi:two-component system, NtrC family, response regulator
MTTETKPLLLLLENNNDIVKRLRERFAGDTEAGFDCAETLQEGLLMGRNKDYDVILIRDHVCGRVTASAVSEFQVGEQPPEIIVYTSTGDPKQAEEVLKLGIWEYLVDPSPADLLPKMVQRALRYRRSKSQDNSGRIQELRTQLARWGIIGRSAMMQACIDQMVRIAQSEANVLIYGESGTGKELFASAIHNLSPRAAADLTIVDCAALPPSLVESLLFGHTKGSFTGADRAQQGLIQQSDGGTLFLDEIGEMPGMVQKKLLRVIQERTYLPVGSTTERTSNFRLIAATNRDLKEMVDEGSFREDLLFRLKTFYLELPPLRLRTADIAELAYFCRDRFCKRHKLKKKKFSPDYLMLLTQYDWPGNVRELFQAIERSLTDAQESPVLHTKHLPPGIRIHAAKRKLRRNETVYGDVPGAASADGQAQQLPTLKQARDRAVERGEKHYLQQLLHRTEGDIKQSCELASVSRSRLYDLLKKYDLVPGKNPPASDT